MVLLALRYAANAYAFVLETPRITSVDHMLVKCWEFLCGHYIEEEAHVKVYERKEEQKNHRIFFRKCSIKVTLILPLKASKPFRHKVNSCEPYSMINPINVYSIYDVMCSKPSLTDEPEMKTSSFNTNPCSDNYV